MAEEKKTAKTMDNIKQLSQTVSSGDLMSASKNAKELRKRTAQLMAKAKAKLNEIAEEAKAAQVVEKSESVEMPSNKEIEKKTEKEVEKVAPVIEKKEEPKNVEEPKKAEVIKEEKPVSEPEIAPVVSTATEKANKVEKEEEKKEEVKPTPVSTATTTPAPTTTAAPAPQKKEQTQAEKDAIARAIARAIERDKKWKAQNAEEKSHESGYRRFDNRQNGNKPNNNKPQGERPFNKGGDRNKPFDKDGDVKKPNVAKKPVKPSAPTVVAFVPPTQNKNFANKKKDKPSEMDNKKSMNKRTLIRKGYLDQNSDGYDDMMGSHKIRPRKAKESNEPVVKAAPIKIEHAVVTTDIIPIKTLSEKIGVPAVEITKRLFNEGQLKTINDSIDFATAEYIAIEYGVTLEYKAEITAEEELLKEAEDDEKDLQPRPPVVTVMGHVDHGKTSLLDAIKNSQVTATEAGGITQHIGAYSVEINGRKITFIDTPGHEAFTAMRMRGAQITDVAILVVAADDGVMPQTIEAINHIKAAGVEMVVAINKMDKHTADKNRIMQQLVEYEVLSEEWGGSTIMVPVSAKTKAGITDLLESVLTVADVMELKANPNRKASGIIVEAQLDKGKGPVATMLVQNGTLKVGDAVISGMATGKIRAMIDDKGRRVNSAGPSTAVSILGLSEVPEAGDRIIAVSDDKLSRAVLAERQKKQREDLIKQQGAMSLEEAARRLREGQLKGLNLIIKADVQGSYEAVKQALLKLSNDEITVKVIHGGVGAINESDVMLASTSNAVIIGFNVRPDTKSKAMAERDKVQIKTYRIIYDAIEDISAALKGMLAPKFNEVFLGSIEVRDVFKISGVGAIAGGYVIEGKIVRNSKAKLVRQGIIIHEGNISSLKRFKDDVKEVAQGYECGIGLENYNDIKVGDIIEVSIMEEVKQD